MGDISAHLAQLQRVIDTQMPKAMEGCHMASLTVQIAMFRQSRILGVES